MKHQVVLLCLVGHRWAEVQLKIVQNHVSSLFVHAPTKLDEELHEVACLDRQWPEQKSDDAALQVNSGHDSDCFEAELVLAHFKSRSSCLGPELGSNLSTSEHGFIHEDDVLLLLDQLDDLRQLLELSVQLPLQLTMRETHAKLEISQFYAI